MDRPLYLDHNATTPFLPGVVKAMMPYLRAHFGNPSSAHAYGRRAKDAIEGARVQVAELLGCAPSEIVFTSGGTEANNLAIVGAAEAAERRHIVMSTIEHPSVSEPCRWLASHGWAIGIAEVDARGRVKIESLADALRDDTALVTVMHANNETGSLQPIADIAKIAKARGALVHTDAAQSTGKIATRVDDLGVDLLSIAGHKLYGPKGVGALYVRAGTPIRPFALGAGQERGLRGGTENVAAIVGLGVACDLARERIAAGSADATRAVTDRLWERLRIAIPGIALNGHTSERLPNTLNVRFPGATGTAVLARAPEIAASTGSACHDGGESASPVLVAMGIAPDLALGAVRLSIGYATTNDEVDLAANALVRAWRRVRGVE